MATSRYLIAWVLAGAAGAALAVGGCLNPVESDAIKALGDEKPGVETGPLHRPGQPCLLCHRDGGQGPAFMVAGTVFATPREDIGVESVEVTIIDAAGKRVTKTTNCAGNFYMSSDEGDLAFPLHAEIECTLPDGTKQRSVMGTRIGRDGSCSGCHTGDPSATSPGRVSCAQTEPDPPFVATCGGGG